MEIKKIHSMQWAANDKTVVAVIADTDEADNVLIGTPYSEESIIWATIKEYPVQNILDYEPPVYGPEEIIEQ